MSHIMSHIQEEEGQEPQREIYSPIYFPCRPAPVDVAKYVSLSPILQLQIESYLLG